MDRESSNQSSLLSTPLLIPRELTTNSILADTRRIGKSMARKLVAASQLFITH